MRKLIVSLLLVAGSSHAGAILYNNSTNDTGYTDGFAVNGLVEAGDQITLANGIGGLATEVTTALYNSASVGGTADVTLRLYSVGDGNVLGPQLVASTLAGQSFTAGTVTYLDFTGLNTEMAGTLVWTLSYESSDAIAPELLDFDAPTVGSSDNTTVWWDTGSGLTLTTPGYDTENYYMTLDGVAAPEPGALMLMGVGVGLLGLLRVFKRAG
jgi:hypothetical protein